MKWLDKLVRKMGRHYIPDLMKYLCLAMLGVFLIDYLPLARNLSPYLVFNRDAIFHGQIWRLLTFAIVPTGGYGLFSILLNLYFYYFLGMALERQWGNARFNIYFGIGLLFNIVVGLITGYATNSYLYMSIMLAYTILYPETIFNLFFFLPVKAKWLGIFWAVTMIYEFIMTPFLIQKLSLLASLAPFFLFFGKDLWLLIRLKYRQMKFRWQSRK